MFPLNNQPEGLPALLDRFENSNAVYAFVREHLRCEALVTLSFVRVHYPEIDLELLKALPPTPSGRVDMDPHYGACKDIADYMLDRLSPRAIIRGRIRASWRNDLAKYLNLA
jgi:hypothetical protein